MTGTIFRVTGNSCSRPGSRNRRGTREDYALNRQRYRSLFIWLNKNRLLMLIPGRGRIRRWKKTQVRREASETRGTAKDESKTYSTPVVLVWCLSFVNLLNLNKIACFYDTYYISSYRKQLQPAGIKKSSRDSRGLRAKSTTVPVSFYLI